MIAIFLSVISTIGLRQQTDLHVPQLLGYRQAINHDGPKQKTYKRPAYLLVLPISICRLVLEHLSLTGGVSQQIPLPYAHLHTRSLVQSKCCIAIYPILYFKLATCFFRSEGPATCIAQAKAARRAAGLGNSPPENPQGLKARPFAGMIVDSARTARQDSPSTVDVPYFQRISNPAVTRGQPPVQLSSRVVSQRTTPLAPPVLCDHPLRNDLWAPDTTDHPLLAHPDLPK